MATSRGRKGKRKIVRKPAKNIRQELHAGKSLLELDKSRSKLKLRAQGFVSYLVSVALILGGAGYLLSHFT
jgi:hypothetical protein